MRDQRTTCKRALWFLALLALVAGPAQARGEGDWRGLAELSYNRVENPALSSDILGQRYFLSYGHTVTSPIQYLLKFLYLDDTLNVFTQGLRSGQRSAQPGFRLVYTQPGFVAEGLYEFQWLDRWVRDGGSSDSMSHRAALALTLTPVTGLDLSAWAEWVGQRVGQPPPQPELETNQYRATLTALYKLGGLSLTAGPGMEYYENATTGYERLTLTPYGRVDYIGTAFGSALSFGVYGAAAHNRIEETLRSSTPVIEPREIMAQSAYYVVTSTPNDTSTTPSTPIPALIDRNFTASTGISLGPDGLSNQNLALDMGRIETLDEMRVFVRDALGNLIAWGGPISWSVFVSTDGVSWILVPITSFFYDAGIGAWSISFQPSSYRYFKVVNFGVNVLPTLVTELTIYEHRTFLPDQTRLSTNSNQMGGVNATAQIAPKLSLSFSGSVGATQTQRSSEPERTSLLGFGVASISAGPWADVTLNGSFSRQNMSQTGSPELRVDTASLGLSYNPSLVFSASLSGSLLLQDYGDLQLRTGSATVSAGVRPLPEVLSFGVFGSLSKSISLGTGLEQTVLSTGGNAIAKLLRDLELWLGANAQRTISGQNLVPEGVPIAPTFLQSNYFARIWWRPSPQLDVSAQLGYTVSQTISGLVQNYRLYWNPFLSGAFTLSVNFQQDVQPLGSSMQSRLSVIPRWVISRHAALGATLFRQWGTGPQSIALETYLVTLSFYL